MVNNILAFSPAWRPVTILEGVTVKSTSQCVRRCDVTMNGAVLPSTSRRLPICCVDVMDTLVADPFSRGMAQHFGFDTFSDFLAAKKDGVWIDFELGRLTEEELSREFFRDSTRMLDVKRFKCFLRDSYELLPGISELLEVLRQSNIEVHAFSNYPIWYLLIEEKLRLQQRGVKWTFVSAVEGLRKPDKKAYLRVARNANVNIRDCVLLDDREVNCDAAVEAGFRGAVHFVSAEQAVMDLRKIYSGD